MRRPSAPADFAASAADAQQASASGATTPAAT